MSRVYLETTVIAVWLFGAVREPARYRAAVELFRLIEQGRLQGVVSFYTLQEIYAFCEDNFPATEAPTVAKLALFELLGTEVELVPLLDRRVRLLEGRRFVLPDPTDQPHAIAAWVHDCEAIVTYDEHFRAVKDLIAVMTPEELLRRV
jgi:predicted nucleic acid-binding protein